MELLILIWLACGLIAASIGSKKGEGFLGFIFGILLGPLGILIMICGKGNRVHCRHCQELIHMDATTCPFCRNQVTPTDRSQF